MSDMSGHGEPGETCKFGHVLLANDHDNPGSSDSGIPSSVRDRVVSGEISDLEELEAAHKNFDDISSPKSLSDLCGEPFKNVKVQAKSQGFPRAAIFDAADKWDEDLDYSVHKTEEKIFVSPQSNLHGEYMQRKQQAEQNVRNTMQNISQLTKQKHMLEHDIRKLRSRAEAMRTGDEKETTLKGDFIELVDGAGAAGQQGGDEASLKFYRDNNIYPSIVADFQEMRGLDDLKDPEDSEYDDPRLDDIPNNEKAILRKKWSMYEKWKDLYGSEVQRKLKDLKQQLRSIESSIERTKEWLDPYVRDMVMINQGGLEDLKAETSDFYFGFKGTSTQARRLEFIAYRPMKNDHGKLTVIEDESEATHYRVIFIHGIHVNLAGWEQPQSPAQGPSSSTIFWHPVIVCRHVFENFFKEKIQRQADLFEQVVDEYKGVQKGSEGEKLRNAREEKNMSVRELREKVNEEVEVPVSFSSTIRRVEDGIDQPGELNEEYGENEDVLKIIEDVLDMEEGFGSDTEEEDMHEGIDRKLREFTGQVDEFYLLRHQNPLDELKNEMKFNFYYDFKLGLGLYTMK
ncbi:MAG: multiprotein-bridging factor 1 family protein [Candidatus Nanohaloarchaea archaeon]